MWHEERLLIDGELVDAAGGAMFPTINPATEEVLGVAADAGPEDAEAAVAAARRAFDSTDWCRDHAFRAHCLRQLHEALTSRVEEMRAINCPKLTRRHPHTPSAEHRTPSARCRAGHRGTSPRLCHPHSGQPPEDSTTVRGTQPVLD